MAVLSYDGHEPRQTDRQTDRVERSNVWYPSKGEQDEVTPDEFGGDDAANERCGWKAASEEDAFDAVTMADELNALHQVHHEAVQQRASRVLSLKLTCTDHQSATVVVSHHEISAAQCRIPIPDLQATAHMDSWTYSDFYRQSLSMSNTQVQISQFNFRRNEASWLFSWL